MHYIYADVCVCVKNIAMGADRVEPSSVFSVWKMDWEREKLMN